MSVESSDYPPSVEQVKEINKRGAETVSAAAKLLCQKTVELVYVGIGIHLLRDQEEHRSLELQNYPPGSAVDVYVREDRFTAPKQGEEFRRTFSTRLEPRTHNDNHEYIKLHVPSGDISIHQYEMPDTDTVSEVYVEYGDRNDKHWYTVDKNGIYEYIPYVHQEDEEPVIDDSGIWLWLDEQVPESIETIASIMRRIVNWKTLSQNRHIVTDKGE